MMVRVLTMVLLAHQVLAEADRAQWAVPVGEQVLSTQVQGKIAVSPAAVMSLRPECEGAIVTWISPRGTRAERGEMVVRFDTKPIQEKHAKLVRALTLQRGRAAAKVLEIEAAIAASETAVAAAVAQQAALDAKVREASAGDEELIARLTLEVEVARRSAATAQTELARKQQLMELGELAREKLEDAKLTTIKAQEEVALSAIELNEAGDGSDPVAARRAVWAAERHRIKHGLDKNGQAELGKGVAATLAKHHRRLERYRATVAREQSFKELEIRLAAKAAWPHVPLRKLSISQPDGQLVRQVDFTAPNGPIDFVSVDDADGASETAGYGFETAVAQEWSTDALVVRGEAVWRCDLPPGEYLLDLELGDKSPWDYVFVAGHDQVIAAENSLAKPTNYEAKVSVGAEGLRLQMGLPAAAMVAPRAGAVQRAWADVGEKVRSNAPAVYLAPDDKLTVELLVHHLQLPYFSGEDELPREIEIRRTDGRWVAAEQVRVSDDPTAFFAVAKGWRDMDEEQDPREKTAREVRLSVPVEFADGFSLGAHVQCRATIGVGMPQRAVPAFLVDETPTGLSLIRNDKQLSTSGFRCDDHFVILTGLKPGDRLQLPAAIDEASNPRRYSGEIVANAKVPLTANISRWARIEKLIPHGSEVKQGDWVMRLFRPEQQSTQAMAAAKAAAAEGQYLQSVEARQAALNKQRADLVDAVQEEKLLADRVAEHRTVDESSLAEAREARRAAEAELALMERRLREIAATEATRLSRERYQRRQQILRRQVFAKQLSAVASRRPGDLAKQLKDVNDWRTARDELTTRESKIQLELKEQELNRQQAQRKLARDLESKGDADHFEANRELYAPASGQIFYRNGYNDLTRSIQRIDEQFVVWRGLTIAEILDVNQLALKVQLPETAYRSLAEGDELPVVIDEFDNRLLSGRISDKGLRVYQTSSRDNKQASDVFDLTKVFDATVSFSVPDELRGKLKPGMRGAVILP